jgi:hypothetical protein
MSKCTFHAWQAYVFDGWICTFFHDRQICVVLLFYIGWLSHFMPEPSVSVHSGIRFSGNGLPLQYAVVVKLLADAWSRTLPKGVEWQCALLCSEISYLPCHFVVSVKLLLWSFQRLLNSKTLQIAPSFLQAFGSKLPATCRSVRASQAGTDVFREGFP